MCSQLRKSLAVLVVPILAVWSPLAHADSVSILGFNIASMSIQAKTATGAAGFSGVRDSGDLSIKATAYTTVNVDVDGKKKATLSSVSPTALGTKPVFDLTGDILLSNGSITGGLIKLMAREASGVIDSYAFKIAPGSGSLHKVPGVNSYLLAGLTYNGLFNDPSFGGVDVSFWKDQQPVLGSFLQFNYNPDSTGFDSSANLDVAVFGESFALPTVNGGLAPQSVPLPKSVWGGAILLFAMGVTKYRGRATA